MNAADMLAKERRARLAAERMIEVRDEELRRTRRKLAEMSRELAEARGLPSADRDALVRETNAVRAELALATSRVVIAEQRLWQSIETIRDGFAVFDRDEVLVAANGPFLRVFDGLDSVGPGISCEELLRLAVEEGVVDASGPPGAWVDTMLCHLRAPVIEETTVQLWSGRTIRLLARRGESGDVVCLALDITPSMRRVDRLRRARISADAANRAKSAFLANMSHEIRTPMNGVVGMAGLLSETTLDGDQRLFVETIRASGEALLSLINDVLDYSKIEAERLVLHPRDFDLHAAITQVMTLMAPAVEGKDVALRLDYSEEAPRHYSGDPVRIGQILTNLIGNAVKFTLHGEVSVSVRFDGSLILSVRDTGIGIAPEMTKHIFGEFNQVEDDRNRQFEGTGLGLAITSRLVALMDGEISVVSTLGEGACFTVSLPLEVAEDPPDMPDADEAPQVCDRPLNILAAEDNRTNRLVLSKMLDGAGVRLRLVEDGEAAVHAVQEDRPDLVFMDISMPRMDGRAATRAIRAWEAETGLPPMRIVALTAHAMEGDAKAILAEGLSGYMTKPVRKEALLAEIDALRR